MHGMNRESYIADSHSEQLTYACTTPPKLNFNPSSKRVTFPQSHSLSHIPSVTFPQSHSLDGCILIIGRDCCNVRPASTPFKRRVCSDIRNTLARETSTVDNTVTTDRIT